MKFFVKSFSLLLCAIVLFSISPMNISFTYYECNHQNAVFYPSVEPGCFTPGTEEYWFCEDCGLYLRSDKTTVIEPDHETTFDELQVINIPATGHAYNEDLGKCDNCDMPIPVYSRVTSLEDVNEDDMYIFVAEVDANGTTLYFVLGGFTELGYENHLVCKNENVGNAIPVIPNEDGTICLVNQNEPHGMKAAEFMFDIEPFYTDLGENFGLTTVMPVLPNHAFRPFQSHGFDDNGIIAPGRYSHGQYSHWDGSEWVIDFYTTYEDENTYRDGMDGYTHAEQLQFGTIGDNVKEGDLLMYTASYLSVGGSVFTLRFRAYEGKYYFICGEDWMLEGVPDPYYDETLGMWMYPTNDVQYAISLYRYDVPEQEPHTCEFGEWTKSDETTHTRACECGNSESAPHEFDAGVVTKEPTVSEEGSKEYTCKGCGYKKSESIDKITSEPENPNNNNKEPEQPDSGDNSGQIVMALSIGAVALGGGGFALYWFVFRKKP